MVEKLSYRSFGHLSPALTELLIKDGVTPLTVPRLQTDLQSYFPYRNETFGGVIYDREGKGPEKPYFKPEGSDWQPEVQAIARIGVQHHYWDALYTSLEAASIDPVKMISMVVLVIHMNPDGSSYLETDSTPERVKKIAEEFGDEFTRFHSYVPYVNYGGDADFYGANHNSIFPMNVKTPDGGRVYVEREVLGLSGEVIDNAWQSWRTLDKTESALYHQATLASYRDLPSPMAAIIERSLSRGECFGGGWAILRALLLRDRMIGDETLDLATSVVSNKAREIMTKNADLLKASKTHAENLSDMYKSARSFRQDVYHY